MHINGWYASLCAVLRFMRRKYALSAYGSVEKILHWREYYCMLHVGQPSLQSSAHQYTYTHSLYRFGTHQLALAAHQHSA